MIIRMLERKISVWIALLVCVSVLDRVASMVWGEQRSYPTVLIARILEGIFIALVTVPMYASMRLGVLKLLVVRPRVLYFLGAVLSGSTLRVLMVWVAQSTDVPSFCFQEVWAVLGYCLVPLSDAIPPRLSRKYLRTCAIAVILQCAAKCVHCPMDPMHCHKLSRLQHNKSGRERTGGAPIYFGDNA